MDTTRPVSYRFRRVGSCQKHASSGRCKRPRETSVLNIYDFCDRRPQSEVGGVEREGKGGRKRERLRTDAEAVKRGKRATRDMTVFKYLYALLILLRINKQCR